MLKNTLPYIAVAVLVFLFIAHYVGFPIALILVMGKSMEPTLRSGDIAVLVKSKPHINDIVLWCKTKFYCIIHRVIEVNDKYIITRGDNMPVPDPPVPVKLVNYKLLFVIPREATLAILSLSLIYLALVLRRNLRNIGFTGKVLLYFALLHLPYALFVYVLPFNFTTLNDVIKIPRIDLATTTQNNNTFMFLFREDDNQSIVSIISSKCGIHECNATLLSRNKIAVTIPWSVFVESCIHGQLRVDVKIVAKCRVGTLYLNTRLPVPLHGLVKTLNGEMLTLCNKNPVPVNVTVKYECFPEWCVKTLSITPYSCTSTYLDNATGKVYVIYSICGGHKRLEFAGWVRK